MATTERAREWLARIAVYWREEHPDRDFSRIQPLLGLSRLAFQMPAFQRRGIFRKLTLAAIEAAEQDDVDLIFNTPNPKSGAGYLKMGWQHVGEIGVLAAPSRGVARGKTSADRLPVPTEYLVNPEPASGPWPHDRAPRGVRTARYSYVRNPDGPWLLYDNQEDPYQMKNLVGDPAHADVQAELEAELQRQLKANNDSVMTSEEAVAKWGYSVHKSGEIPYVGDFTTQSPGPDKGVPCHL